MSSLDMRAVRRSFSSFGLLFALPALLACAACSSSPTSDGTSAETTEEALCADPPCRSVGDDDGTKKTRGGGSGGGAIATVPGPVHIQGYSLDGCNFAGQWSSYWGSPTGTQYSPISFDAEWGSMNGAYNNGTMSAQTAVDSGGNAVLVGQWKRTIGNSGGPCQYGNFWFRISGDASSCSLAGQWDYCGTGQAFSWLATQSH